MRRRQLPAPVRRKLRRLYEDFSVRDADCISPGDSAQTPWEFFVGEPVEHWGWRLRHKSDLEHSLRPYQLRGCAPYWTVEWRRRIHTVRSRRASDRRLDA